ncbi:MAG: MBL fold metallo-hydrolase [Candidatus Cloacimonetes bacterium]|nr:MBL fold metallo-hydrolase [Candidatus Cloacimonadota bacterium]
MRNFLIILLFFLFCGYVFAELFENLTNNRTAPIISNTSVAQRTDGSKLVDIYYDLYVANNGQAEISLLLSDNGGDTFEFIPDPELLSGDVGQDIYAGAGKHIIWNAGAEEESFDGDQYRFRIIAHADMLITELFIHENRFHLSTTEPVDVKFTYQPQNGNGFLFESYSTGELRDFIVMPLPVEASGIDYIFDLQIFGADTLLDTLFFFTSTNHTYPLLRVDFVDVAQGDGTLIQTPKGHVIVVDGGYGTYIPSFANPYLEWHGAGYPFMLNYVISENIQQITYLIETHNHMDHWGGLANIRNHFGYPFNEQLRPNNTLGYQVGDYLNIDSEVSFQILNIGYPPGNYSGENNKSIVLRIEYGDVTYLLTGDIESQVENYLVNSNFNLSADVLKVAHHGSNSSSTANFLNATLNRNIKIATISFGTGNPYNHPRSLDRFSEFDVYGTNLPSNTWDGDNYRFDVGNIKTYTDGNIIIVGYAQ